MLLVFGFSVVQPWTQSVYAVEGLGLKENYGNPKPLIRDFWAEL